MRKILNGLPNELPARKKVPLLSEEGNRSKPILPRAAPDCFAEIGGVAAESVGRRTGADRSFRFSARFDRHFSESKSAWHRWRSTGCGIKLFMGTFENRGRVAAREVLPRNEFIEERSIMLRSVKVVQEYGVQARDGDIGRVADLFFDDMAWAVRYLAVDTGRWLPGRRVLLAPHVLGQPDWSRSRLPVDLVREQVKFGPDIDTDKPVSRQQQIALHRYYGWPQNWAGAGVWPNPTVPMTPIIAAVPRAGEEKEENLGNPHLRSAQEVTGYHIQARDGSIGHVEDFIVDDLTWDIRYLVVDTRDWLPAKKVLIAPQWLVGPIKWAERKVLVFMTRESVRNSPEYNPGMPVNRQYETRLYDFYGRPGYWTN